MVRWAGLTHGQVQLLRESGACGQCWGPQQVGWGAAGGRSPLPPGACPKPGLCTDPTPVTPGGREPIPDESGLSVLSNIKSVQNIK